MLESEEEEDLESRHAEAYADRDRDSDGPAPGAAVDEDAEAWYREIATAIGRGNPPSCAGGRSVALVEDDTARASSSTAGRPARIALTRRRRLGCVILAASNLNHFGTTEVSGVGRPRMTDKHVQRLFQPGNQAAICGMLEWFDPALAAKTGRPLEAQPEIAAIRWIGAQGRRVGIHDLSEIGTLELCRYLSKKVREQYRAGLNERKAQTMVRDLLGAQVWEHPIDVFAAEEINDGDSFRQCFEAYAAERGLALQGASGTAPAGPVYRLELGPRLMTGGKVMQPEHYPIVYRADRFKHVETHFISTCGSDRGRLQACHYLAKRPHGHSPNMTYDHDRDIVATDIYTEKGNPRPLIVYTLQRIDRPRAPLLRVVVVHTKPLAGSGAIGSGKDRAKIFEQIRGALELAAADDTDRWALIGDFYLANHDWVYADTTMNSSRRARSGKRRRVELRELVGPDKRYRLHSLDPRCGTNTEERVNRELVSAKRFDAYAAAEQTRYRALSPRDAAAFEPAHSVDDATAAVDALRAALRDTKLQIAKLRREARTKPKAPARSGKRKRSSDDPALAAANERVRRLHQAIKLAPATTAYLEHLQGLHRAGREEARDPSSPAYNHYLDPTRSRVADKGIFSLAFKVREVCILSSRPETQGAFIENDDDCHHASYTRVHTDHFTIAFKLSDSRRDRHRISLAVRDRARIAEARAYFLSDAWATALWTHATTSGGAKSSRAAHSLLSGPDLPEEDEGQAADPTYAPNAEEAQPPLMDAVEGSGRARDKGKERVKTTEAAASAHHERRSARALAKKPTVDPADANHEQSLVTALAGFQRDELINLLTRHVERRGEKLDKRRADRAILDRPDSQQVGAYYDSLLPGTSGSSSTGDRGPEDKGTKADQG